MYGHPVKSALITMLLAVPLLAPADQRDKNPSLAASTKSVQEKIGGAGKVTFEAYLHDEAGNRDWTNEQSREISAVTIPSRCRIRYHEIYTVDGTTRADNDYAIPLGSVQDLAVMPVEEDMKNSAELAGNPGWAVTRIEPPIFALRIRRKGEVSNTIDFADRTTADQVAQELVHAVELCDGSK